MRDETHSDMPLWGAECVSKHGIGDNTAVGRLSSPRWARLIRVMLLFWFK